MHSIWLMPDIVMTQRLRSIIESLSHGLDSPVFEPHITFVGDISGDIAESEKKCMALKPALTREPSTFQSIEMSESHFMYLFATVSVSDHLHALRTKLFQSLNMDVSEWRPHISLAYGAGKVAKRRRISKELTSILAGVEFSISSLEIVMASQQTKPDVWEVVKRIDFNLAGAG